MHLRHLQTLLAVAGIIHILALLPACTPGEVSATLDTAAGLLKAAADTAGKNPVTYTITLPPRQRPPAVGKTIPSPAAPVDTKPVVSLPAPSPADTTTTEGPDL